MAEHCEACGGWLERVSGTEFICADCGRLLDIGTGTGEGIPTVIEPIKEQPE